MIQKEDVGRQIRLNRIVNPKSGKMLIVPLDHGIVGTVKGIENPSATISKIVAGGADAVIFNIGLASSVFKSYMGKCGAILNLTNCVVDKSQQTLLASVEQAIRLGADVVSVQITLGSTGEVQMVKNFQNVYDDCFRFGIPVLLMSYFNQDAAGEKSWVDCITHTARMGAELGADIVKISYTGEKDSFAKVISASPIPVVAAGGLKKDDVNETLQMVRDVIDAGGSGIAMGRNIWQYENPEKLVRALAMIIHENATVSEANEVL
jgi:DhnA family fructose-bisphosphate aldolase class Ia